MRKYPADHWLALGQWVHDARHQAGITDTRQWEQAVGRSSRMLLGLERGETVGAGTLKGIAEALDVPLARLYRILESGSAPLHTWSDAEDAAEPIHVHAAQVFRRASGRFGVLLETSAGPIALGRAHTTEEDALAFIASLGLSAPADRPDLQAVANEGGFEGSGEFDNVDDDV